jgi:hypothetical protein
MPKPGANLSENIFLKKGILFPKNVLTLTKFPEGK